MKVRSEVMFASRPSLKSSAFSPLPGFPDLNSNDPSDRINVSVESVRASPDNFATFRLQGDSQTCHAGQPGEEIYIR